MIDGVCDVAGLQCMGAMVMRNPYYEEWEKVRGRSQLLCWKYTKNENIYIDLTADDDQREVACEILNKINTWVGSYTHKFSWAVPDDQAIEIIAAYSPLVEVGAGTGYWSWLLREAGADVLAYDKYPPSEASRENTFHAGKPTWTQVLQGDESVLDAIEGRTLFLCWPPHNDKMAFNALSRFIGDGVIFVGEYGGATGDPQFFQLLETGWDEEFSAPIPNWTGRDDALFVYRRKGVSAGRPSSLPATCSRSFSEWQEWREEEWEEWKRTAQDDFTRHSAGIRNYEFLQDFCTKCGSTCGFESIGLDIRGNVYGHRTRYNCDCGNIWYQEFCQRESCIEGPLDSRDSELRKCPQCQFLVCPDCGDCRCDAQKRAEQAEPRLVKLEEEFPF